MKKIPSISMDYHLNTVSVAVMVDGQNDLLGSIRINDNDMMVREYFEKIRKEYELRFWVLRKLAGSCCRSSFRPKVSKGKPSARASIPQHERGV